VEQIKTTTTNANVDRCWHFCVCLTACITIQGYIILR